MIFVTNLAASAAEGVDLPDGVLIDEPEGKRTGEVGVYVRDEGCRSSLPEFWNRFYTVNPSLSPKMYSVYSNARSAQHPADRLPLQGRQEDSRGD